MIELLPITPMKQAFNHIEWPRLLVILMAAVLLSTFIGPFNTYQTMSAGKRFAFWLALIGGCGLFAHVTILYVLMHPRLAQLPRLVRLLAGSSVVSFPGLGVFLIVDYSFRDRVHGFDHYFFLWLTVLVFTSIIAYLNFMLPYNLPEADSQDDIANNSARFMQRLPEHLGNKLISLSMNDHYVEVTTSKGSQMLHLKFSQAMEELANYPGIQIHRSHWIAKDALHSIEYYNRTMLAVTSDNRKIPVSSPYRRSVKQLLPDSPK